MGLAQLKLSKQQEITKQIKTFALEFVIYETTTKKHSFFFFWTTFNFIEKI